MEQAQVQSSRLSFLRADESVILQEIKQPGSTRIGEGVIPSAHVDVNKLRNPEAERVHCMQQLAQMITLFLPGGRDRSLVSKCYKDGETFGQELVRRFDEVQRMSRHCQKLSQEYLAGYSMRHMRETPEQFFAAVDKAIVSVGFTVQFFFDLTRDFRAIKNPHLNSTAVRQLEVVSLQPLLTLYRFLRNHGYSHRDLAGVPLSPIC